MLFNSVKSVYLKLSASYAAIPCIVSISLLLQLNATDRDYGLNGFIEFSIVPDAESKHNDFFIEPLTGKLFTQRKLDRERIASYSMLIKAMDRADPGQRRLDLCSFME